MTWKQAKAAFGGARIMYNYLGLYEVVAIPATIVGKYKRPTSRAGKFYQDYGIRSAAAL